MNLSFPDQSRYLPPQKNLWQGRKEEKSPCYFHEIVECKNAFSLKEPAKTPTPALALLGFASDEGIRRNQGREGAKEGPAAFRNALSKLALPYGFNSPIYDFGDITCNDGNLEGSKKALTEMITLLYQYHYHPLVIGGGHEMASAHYEGLTQAFPQKKIGLIQLDAHFDLRPLLEGRGTSGTSFTEINTYTKAQNRILNHLVIGIQPLANNYTLFQKANELSIRFITSNELDKAPGAIEQLAAENELIYVTLCLDVIAAAFAPGVSAPQPLGIFPKEIEKILEAIFSTGRKIAFDIAELSPTFDSDHMTSKLAAYFGAHFLISQNSST